jgi:hypothetical protein
MQEIVLTEFTLLLLLFPSLECCTPSPALSPVATRHRTAANTTAATARAEGRERQTSRQSWQESRPDQLQPRVQHQQQPHHHLLFQPLQLQLQQGEPLSNRALACKLSKVGSLTWSTLSTRPRRRVRPRAWGTSWPLPPDEPKAKAKAQLHPAPQMLACSLT